MRRLPLFFVVDVSESMAGEKLLQMQDGLMDVLRFLRQDPQSLETVYVSFIAFAGIAKVLYPLHEAFAAMAPDLPMGSGTALGAALTVLMDELDRSVRRNTPEIKGDWKPIIYLFTDGKPTDSTVSQIARWQKSYADRAQLIAIALGDGADTSILKQLTPNVFIYNQSGPDQFKKFIQWISLSVSMQSRLVEKDDAVVAPRDLSLLKEAPDTGMHTGMDDTCVTLVGRCQQSKRPYLIKYEKAAGEGPSFIVSGAYPLSESYFEWSGPENSGDLKVSVDLLQGAPACPHCKSEYAMAACRCGKLFCCNGPGSAKCPWCRNNIDLVASESSYEIGRGRG